MPFVDGQFLGDYILNPIHTLVVIPVYNHGATLKKVVQQALQAHPHVLVVDDGSMDGGPERLEDLAIHLVRHRLNLGKGAAIQTAARFARRMGMTHIVTLDSDGQHYPQDIHLFLQMIQKSPTAIIVGRRRWEAGHAPWLSRFGCGFSNFWFRLQTGRVLGDTQSGYRAYPLGVLENLKLRTKRFDFEIEVLVKAAWAGVPLKEVDVAVSYPATHKRISHFHLWTDNLRLTLLNTMLTVRSITPWPHRKIVALGAVDEHITVLHPMRSLKALLTENSSPRRLAAAGGLGVFLGTLPLIACHTIVILFASGFLRLNKAAALATSQLCMPPFVPALCIEIGYFMRHGYFLTEISLQTLGYQALDRLWEWVLGSLVLAPVLGIIIGLITYLLALTRIKRKS